MNISNDFFPLGSGQGTYGSIPVNIVYSQVYVDYNLSYVGGLGKDSEEDYKMDTHWASILGENGYLGTFLYLLLFFFPLRFLKKMKSGEITHSSSFKFLLISSLLVISIESFVLSLPTRFCFMFIYAGLNAIICRYITENININNKYESITGYNELSDKE